MSTLNHAVIEFLQQSNIFPPKAAPLKHSFVCTLGKLTLALFYCWPCFVMFLTSVRTEGGRGEWNLQDLLDGGGGWDLQDVGGGVGRRVRKATDSNYFGTCLSPYSSNHVPVQLFFFFLFFFFYPSNYSLNAGTAVVPFRLRPSCCVWVRTRLACYFIDASILPLCELCINQ